MKANGNKPLTEEQKQNKIARAEHYYGKFMSSLGFEWETDPNASETPHRVAKAWVNDLAEGCFNHPPKITAFDNVDNYDGMVFEGNIQVHSMCSHHHLPFFGVAHVAYIAKPEGKIIGLSKLNRTVEFYSRRPQVQENLTMQIHDHLDEVLEVHGGIAVMVSAKHLCACLRGVKHPHSEMKTSKLSGAFRDGDYSVRQEFYNFVKDMKGC